MSVYEASTESDGVSKEEKLARAKMKVDPRYYMLYNWTHPNDPSRDYDFETNDGEPLFYLTDEDSPLKPDNWGDINVLLFARGCLKTTSVIGIANWFLDEYPNGEVANTAPRDQQKGEVVDRFKERAEDSGLTDRRVRDNINHQKFKKSIQTDDGENKTVYASMKSRSGWGGGEGLRGLHSHIGVMDEFQDADEDMFSNFLEMIDQGLPQCPWVPTIFTIGTPKLENSFFSKLWSMSDRKTWDSDKLEWVQQDTAEEYGTGEGESYEVRGWHIDQYNSPLHDESKIQFKKEAYSEKRFQNEVLAQFYTPEDDLITKQHIEDNFNPDLSMQDRRFYEESQVTVGVDWGGGNRENAAKTVISVLEKLEGAITLSYIDFLPSEIEPHQEIERVEEIIMKFDADKVVVDYGHGNKQLKDLQDGNGTYNTDGYLQTVKGCQYGNIKNKYDPKWETSTGKERFFTADRGYMMESFVEDFKHEEFVIPSKDLKFGDRTEKGTMIVDHLTAPYKDKKETPSGKKKLKIDSEDGRNDDAFQSLTYAWIAQSILGSSRKVHSIVSRDRRGH